MQEDLHPLRLWSLAGRRGRASFLLSSVIVWVAVTLLVGLAYPLLVSGGDASFTAFKVLMTVAIAVAFWSGTAVTVQRLHDLGASGNWVAVPLLLGLALGLADKVGPLPVTASLLVLAQLAWTLWLVLVPGEPETNRFGTPPDATVDLSPVLGTVFRRTASRGAAA